MIVSDGYGEEVGRNLVEVSRRTILILNSGYTTKGCEITISEYVQRLTITMYESRVHRVLRVYEL